MSQVYEGWTDNPVTRHIIVVGNVVDGLRFFGPFVTNDEALEVAESAEFSREILGDTWVITEMEGPI